MGLYDRDYTKDNFQSQFRHTPQMRMTFPQLTPMVKRLLIINIAVFFAQIFGANQLLMTWFSVFPISLSAVLLQPWRVLSYQFLHGGLGHIFCNMLIIFFLGPILERLWGSRRFLTFYLTCGAMGGVLYPLLVFVGWLELGPMIGASGAILGLLAAAAILFPNSVVYIWGIFPMKLFVLALILAAFSIITLLRPTQFGNAGGEAAHLAGMATGAFYVLSGSWRTRMKFKILTGVLEKKVKSRQQLQIELDRILEKVHQKGIHSLTSKEKRILKQATKTQQTQNRP